MNHTAQLLLAAMGIHPGASMLQTLAENNAVRAAIGNLDEVLMHTILRVRTEISHLGGDDILEQVLTKLVDLAGGSMPSSEGVQPAFIPTIYNAGGLTLSLFSTFTQFGTAEDIALSELRIEMLFPADDETRIMLEGLASPTP